jgi:hypothetical protein
MNLEEILADRDLAIYKKKSEIQKSDLSNILFDSVRKAFDNSIDKLEVLVYEAIIRKDRNEEMFKNYLNGWVLNHSIGMRYIKLLFCYNSTDSEYSQNKENFDKYYSQILNKEDVNEWFYAILEAKNIEGSAVVKGSNFLTPVLSLEIIDENTIKVKCAVSPSNVLDSHKDVHIPSLWKKSINEGNYDLLLQEHDMDFDKVITDSISGSLKVYTEIIDVKFLLEKFKNRDSSKVLKTMNMTKNPNIDFIDMMIPHHEMALKMANDFKDKITNSDLKKIVKNILKSQQEEITKMEEIKQAEKSLVKNEPTIVTQRSKKVFIN